MASNGKAVTGTAVMARSANEKKKKKPEGEAFPLQVLWICIGETWEVFTLGDTRKY